MSRTNVFIILGIGLVLLLGTVAGAALLVRSFLMIAGSNTVVATPIVIVEPPRTPTDTIITPTGAATPETAVTPTMAGAISGLVYQDQNENGRYDNGEQLMGNREVWLIAGTACHVLQNATATSYSGADGRYTFNGRFSGSYCVGLVGSDGLLEDVTAVSVTGGQVVTGANLRALITNGSISGYLWDDYCLTGENGQLLAGNCVMDGNGFYHADGMIQPTEGYIAGVAISLRPGLCTSDSGDTVGAVTDSDGRYTFANLSPGVYCVSMNAATFQNAPLLLPGDWTFPARGIWYHQITLAPGEHLPTVNFGWDCQLR
jgi:hypothetical protein